MTLSSLDTTLEVHEIPMLDSCWMMMIPVILGCKPPLKRMPINRDLVTTLEEAGLLNYQQACTAGVALQPCIPFSSPSPEVLPAIHSGNVYAWYRLVVFNSGWNVSVVRLYH